MIVLRLCGGLGNQLFQYAAGRRLALQRGAELVFDLGWYHRTPRRDTPRAFELDRYAVRGRKADSAELLWCRLHEGPLLRRLTKLPRRWKHHRERTEGFDAAVLSLPDGVYLDGYWQSHRYFEDAEASIRGELVPHAPFGERDQEIAASVAEGSAIAVHVRRGDYVTNAAANQTHGLCSPDYYARAFAHLLSRVAAPRFFVFSDDASWARQNIQFPGPATFVDHNGPDQAFQDLRLMSLCAHQITANSSFSWWGAWLNPSTDKIVVTPRQWFVNLANDDTRSPSSWVRV